MQKALLVIDVQMALAHDDAAGADRSCREAEDNISKLLADFRTKDVPIIHIHHHGTDPDDPFHPDAEGSKVQPIANPQAGEPIIVKTTSSGFVNTELLNTLTELRVEQTILCGATANHCVESTTRSSADLGFNPVYVSDAVWAYGVTGPDGQEHSGDQIHSTCLATLKDEIAEVQNTKVVLASL